MNGSHLDRREFLRIATAATAAASLPAALTAMKKKGRLQVGCDADVVVFDPATVQDKATFVAPAQTTVGFRHVVVNGVPVIADAARIGDALPGKPVRREV